ncbi:unnamed protein product [Chilo suppressalis]|uniref:Nicastrin n=1 Tax=Chilo suppressalis TaxID=168631 RepID=A0ABN8BGI4_CHISP|nr:hypothetical protein evm_012737 [Chilo suppressalis]CAH0405938.1 unnamed protein product [Chilo suppressalis]
MLCRYIFLLICAVFIKLTCGERLHEQIYSSIEGGAACFRRLNGSHQAGCSSANNGAVGVVHFVRELSDANWLVKNATAGSYMAIVNTALFREVIDTFLKQPENIAGVLLYHNSSLGIPAFSQDSRCPNEYFSGPGSTCSSLEPSSSVWNEGGTNLMRRDIPFPIFFIPESRLEEINKIEQCFQSFNLDMDNQNGRPLCSVQMHSFMFAAVDSTVCMRRSASSALITSAKVCDPLGDRNVYYSLFPQSKETKKRVVMVTARIDSASLFDGISPGAASSAVGMVTLITAASILAQMIPVETNTYDKNVLWTLFNGETFDYIGSQKVAYDMRYGEWPPLAPLKYSDVEMYLELGQIGGSLLLHKEDEDWPFKMFAPVTANNLVVVSETVEEMSRHLATFNMSLQLTSTQNLPPSSLHSFRRILQDIQEEKNGKNLSSVDIDLNGAMSQMVMVDHNDHFTNVYYNSALDDYNNIGFNYHNLSIGNDGTFITTNDLIANGTMKRFEAQVKIALLATAVARTLYRRIVGESYTGNLTASAHLVDEMLYCFMKSQACRLLLAADYAKSGGGEENLPEKPAPLYVGVTAWPGTASVFAGHLLALLTGTHLAVNRTQCEAMDKIEYSYYWLKGWNHSGVCIQTTMNFSQAISPAFTISDYDFASGEFSTWTESVWREMWVRVFVAAGGGGARAAGVTGAVATACVAALTYWLRSRARHIFIEAPAASLVSTDAAAGIMRTVNC